MFGPGRAGGGVCRSRVMTLGRPWRDPEAMFLSLVEICLQRIDQANPEIPQLHRIHRCTSHHRPDPTRESRNRRTTRLRQRVEQGPTGTGQRIPHHGMVELSGRHLGDVMDSLDRRDNGGSATVSVLHLVLHSAAGRSR